MADFPEPLIRVMALHALAYCERLFYLEKVEEIRVADHRVYAGRILHEAEVDIDGEGQSVTLAGFAITPITRRCACRSIRKPWRN